MLEFNEEKHYLGRLCKHGHEYKDTGKSLRRKSNRTCTKCENITNARRRKKNPEKIRQQGVKSYYKNKEKYQANRKKWNQDNWEKVKLYYQRSEQRRRDAIHDLYVKKILVAEGLYTSTKNIPQHIVDARRDLIKLNRKIRETSKIIKEQEEKQNVNGSTRA